MSNKFPFDLDRADPFRPVFSKPNPVIEDSQSYYSWSKIRSLLDNTSTCYAIDDLHALYARNKPTPIHLIPRTVLDPYFNKTQVLEPTLIDCGEVKTLYFFDPHYCYQDTAGCGSPALVFISFLDVAEVWRLRPFAQGLVDRFGMLCNRVTDPQLLDRAALKLSDIVGSKNFDAALFLGIGNASTNLLNDIQHNLYLLAFCSQQFHDSLPTNLIKERLSCPQL